MSPNAWSCSAPQRSGAWCTTAGMGQWRCRPSTKSTKDPNIFRTYNDLRRKTCVLVSRMPYKVAVEVDQTDPEARTGCVVLVQGAAHHIDTEAERAAIADLGLESWVQGEPERFIRVNPTQISGQRLRQA